jgi:hypothetical protein
MHFDFGILEMHLKNAYPKKKIMYFENAFPWILGNAFPRILEMDFKFLAIFEHCVLEYGHLILEHTS